MPCRAQDDVEMRGTRPRNGVWIDCWLETDRSRPSSPICLLTSPTGAVYDDLMQFRSGIPSTPLPGHMPHHAHQSRSTAGRERWRQLIRYGPVVFGGRAAARGVVLGVPKVPCQARGQVATGLVSSGLACNACLWSRAHPVPWLSVGSRASVVTRCSGLGAANPVMHASVQRFLRHH
jgi:hypothetical protein